MVTRCQRCAELGPDRQCPSCAVDSRGEAFTAFCLVAVAAIAFVAALMVVTR